MRTLCLVVDENGKTHYHQSKKEATRHQQLWEMEQRGEIEALTIQKPYTLYTTDIYGKEIAVCKYYADFVYWKDNKWVVEDTKGVRTETYKLKAKWLRLSYGITVLET